MTGWTESTLGNVADVIPGYAFKGESFGDVGEKVIKIKDITPPTVSIHDVQKVDLAHYSASKLEKFKLRKGDFVVAMTGATIGKVGRLLEKAEVYINQRVAKIEPKPGVDKEFVYFCLLDSGFDGFVQNNIDSHSAQENISGQSIGRYPINLPSLPEQKAIAAVLISLDDKIDLLRRQNKTLETMAETLFRQWFVEEAQEDWEEQPLASLGEVVCGKTPSKAEARYFGGDVPFIKIPDMHGQAFIYRTEDSLTPEGRDSQRKKTIPAGAICVSCIATVGLVSMTTIESQTNQQINSILPTRVEYRYFLYLFMKSSYDLLHAMASGGTATLNLNTGNFSSISIPFPGTDLLNKFHESISPVFQKILENQKQIQTLEKLRDTLLPKLMSGEVRVEV